MGRVASQSTTSRAQALLLVVPKVWKGLIIPGRDDVGAGEPAVEIDIGAALGAEGPIFFHRGLAADWTFAGSCLGHQTPERFDWLSQLK
jgi:hypothetical protein